MESLKSSKNEIEQYRTYINFIHENLLALKWYFNQKDFDCSFGSKLVSKITDNEGKLYAQMFKGSDGKNH